MTHNKNEKENRDDLFIIKPGNLIKLRSHNPDTGEETESIYLRPLPDRAFESTVPVGIISTQKLSVLYDSDSKPILFLGTNRMKPGTFSPTQTRTIFLHRVLFGEIIYYFITKQLSDLENKFYILKQGK